MSRLLHGAALAALAFSSTIGYVGQLVSKGTPYPDLEGPGFGTRVGIYHVDNLEKPFLTDKREEAGHASEIPFKVILYKVPSGAIEESNAEDSPTGGMDGERYTMVSTLPAF